MKKFTVIACLVSLFLVQSAYAGCGLFGLRNNFRQGQCYNNFRQQNVKVFREQIVFPQRVVRIREVPSVQYREELFFQNHPQAQVRTKRIISNSGQKNFNNVEKIVIEQRVIHY